MRKTFTFENKTFEIFILEIDFFPLLVINYDSSSQKDPFQNLEKLHVTHTHTLEEERSKKRRMEKFFFLRSEEALIKGESLVSSLRSCS